MASRQIVMGSGFRLATATAGASRFDGKTLDLLIGNSQLMDGLNAEEMNRKLGGRKVFNAAFNGLYSPALLAVAETFMENCRCKVERIFVNAGAMEDESPGTSEAEIFVAASNPKYAATVLEDQKSRQFSSRFLPALYYNNEMFHRSFYYWALQRDDQGHGNDYKFRIPPISPKQLGGSQKKAQIDHPRLEQFNRIARMHGARIVAVLPPLHPLYVENRIGYAEYREQVKTELQRYGIELLDHSADVVTSPDGFADLIHMNLSGQRQYSQYFVDHVLGR
jgi:hypothetical protein